MSNEVPKNRGYLDRAFRWTSYSIGGLLTLAILLVALQSAGKTIGVPSTHAETLISIETPLSTNTTELTIAPNETLVSVLGNNVLVDEARWKYVCGYLRSACQRAQPAN